MAFRPLTKKQILQRDGERCVICGAQFADAVHIIDPRDWKNKNNPKLAQQPINGITLCPNCHRAFDDRLRPYLHKALKAFGLKNLPKTWETSNKLTTSRESKK